MVLSAGAPLLSGRASPRDPRRSEQNRMAPAALWRELGHEPTSYRAPHTGRYVVFSKPDLSPGRFLTCRPGPARSGKPCCAAGRPAVAMFACRPTSIRRG